MTKTIIGSTLVIEGDLESDEPLEVFGAIRGKRVAAKNVRVAPSGTVDAEVSAEQVRVEGRAKGSIFAAVRLEIAEEAEVEADVRSARVVIADGANFRGNVDVTVKAPKPVDERVR